jgi:hypothetical protein
MWWGAPKYSNNKNGTKYNIGDEDTQLPIMKLHTDEQKSGGQVVWLRDVCTSSHFAVAYDDGSAYGRYASASYGVRAFFLID